MRVFSSGRGTSREQWSVRFPCIAFISVTAVDFESLSACVDVLSVQHEAVRLPETVEDVPLIELWPTTEQREQSVNAATTADTIPNCVARSIVLLRNSAINAHEKLRDLDSSLCEGDLTSDDDSLLPANYISLCAEMNARLDGLMSKWTLYENPIIRAQYMIKARNNSRVTNDQTLTVMTSSEDALALEPEEVVVELRNCTIRGCGVGIQMYSGSTVELNSTTIRDCTEHSI
ncbi:SHC SH2 domain-binding protein 1-like protein, partial [Operophtera brumata]